MRKILRIIHSFRKLYWWVSCPITMGARAIVAIEGKVLLIQHQYLDEWYLPGGKAKRGEDLVTTIRIEEWLGKQEINARW